MYMEDINIFALNEEELKTFTQTIRYKKWIQDWKMGHVKDKKRKK